MTTDNSATSRALPLLPFSFQKLLQTMLFNVLQIINHVHPILFFIAFANLLDKLTGKLVAFISELNLIVQKLFTTFLFEKRALLVSRTASYAVRQPNPLSFSVIYQSKLVATHVTVHATNCNKFRFQVMSPQQLLFQLMFADPI
jgi:hypothetical protein